MTVILIIFTVIIIISFTVVAILLIWPPLVMRQAYQNLGLDS